MKTIQIFVISIVSTALLTGFFPKKVNQQFPSLTGSTLNNKEVTLPKDTKGKYTILGLAFSRDAEADLSTWFEPGYETFAINYFHYDFDVNLYFVPVIGGANKIFAGKIEKDMKEKVDKDLKPYVLLYMGKTQEIENALNITDGSKPYFYVLDPDGKIVYETSGPYSEAKLAKMVGIVRRDK